MVKIAFLFVISQSMYKHKEGEDISPSFDLDLPRALATRFLSDLKQVI